MLDCEQQDLRCNAPDQHRRRHQKEIFSSRRSMAATSSSKKVRARLVDHRRDVLLACCLMAAALPCHSHRAAALEGRRAKQFCQSHRQCAPETMSAAAFALSPVGCQISWDRRNRDFCAPSASFPKQKGGRPGEAMGQADSRPHNARLGIINIRGRSSTASYHSQRRGGGAAAAAAAAAGGGGGGGGESNIALVTGANRGLGRGLVKELALSGYTVIACCRDKKKGDELAAELQAPGSCVISYELDVSSEQRCVRARGHHYDHDP